MNDLISRQAAIDKIETAAEFWSNADEYAEGCHAGYLLAANLLKALPSAERRGRWINGNEGIWNAVILPKCSICGETFYEMNVNINGEYPYNYCPNCGARMEAITDD